MRKTSTLLLVLGLLVLAGGCGGDADDEATTAATAAEEEAATVKEETTADTEGGRGEGTKDGAAKGTTVVLDDSEFGAMLYDASDQAIYVFERDGADKSNCYGECAAAWPPVLTSGAPVAGDGVDDDLLGTTKRRDGGTQVTYGGRPLYYYAHEAPGEVRCHNIDLNGGLWWVVGADGEPLA